MQGSEMLSRTIEDRPECGEQVALVPGEWDSFNLNGRQWHAVSGEKNTFGRVGRHPLA